MVEADARTLSRQQLEEHARALKTVLQVAEVVNQAQTLPDLIERVVDAIVEFTRFPCCGLFRLNAAGTHLDMIAWRNISEEVLKAAKVMPMEGSLTGHAIRTGVVVTTTDLTKDARLEPGTQAALTKEGYVEAASVPLLYQDKALGSINLIYHTRNPLTQNERDTLLTIGRTVATPMANLIALDERRKLEEQARRNEQLEQLGILAGGIAHDFNNLLTAVLGNLSVAQLLLQRQGPTDRVLQILAESDKASHRAADLVRQLLTFSKGGTPLLRPTAQLGELVRDCAEFSVHGSKIRLELQVAEQLYPVAIDASQIAQTIQNLVINAVQASAAGAKIQVIVENAQQPPPVTPPAERWVHIVVADQGCGIPPENLPHIFDPYFTTKPGGSGIGLPTVRSIIQRHQGHLEVNSVPGKGTRFDLFLRAQTELPHALPIEVDTAAAPARGGLALVLDDEPNVRNVAKRMLKLENYAVTEVATGEEAVAACNQAVAAGNPFDLVVLDLTIAGGLGGKEAMAAIRAILPNVTALVSSGYSNDEAMAHYEACFFDAVLQKPYTYRELSSAIGEALQHRARAQQRATSDSG